MGCDADGEIWIGFGLMMIPRFSFRGREEELSAFASHGWRSYHWSTIACICIRVETFRSDRMNCRMTMIDEQIFMNHISCDYPYSCSFASIDYERTTAALKFGYGTSVANNISKAVKSLKANGISTPGSRNTEVTWTMVSTASTLLNCLCPQPLMTV